MPFIVKYLRHKGSSQKKKCVTLFTLGGEGQDRSLLHFFPFQNMVSNGLILYFKSNIFGRAGFLGPIGPLELGLSVCLSVGWLVLVEIVHWVPLDDSIMHWGMGIGDWELGGN